MTHQEIDLLGWIGWVVGFVLLTGATIYNTLGNRVLDREFTKMTAAYRSMAEAFQIHATHCHVVADTQRLKLDLDCVIARIEQANDESEGETMRDHLMDRLLTCDVPRLRRWSDKLTPKEETAA